MIMIEHEIVKQICIEFEGIDVCKFVLLNKNSVIDLIYTGILQDESEAERRLNLRLTGSSFKIRAQRLSRMRFNIFIVSEYVHHYWIRKQPGVVFIAKKAEL